VASPKLDAEIGDMFRNFYEWKDLEPRRSLAVTASGDSSQATELFIPGGGIAKSLFEDL